MRRKAGFIIEDEIERSLAVGVGRMQGLITDGSTS